MNAIIGIGAGAGFVSALLFAVIATGQLIALPLFFVAPLPIALAALGWNHKAGLIAALVGAACIGLAFAPSSGLTFALAVGLPTWWTAYLVLLARSEDTHVQWYPLGRLLVWIVVLSAGLTVLGALMLGDGDYATFVKRFERAALLLNDVRPGIFEGLSSSDKDGDVAAIGRLFAAVAPPISSGVSVLSSVGLLYGAARIVRASGRLPRPWTPVSAVQLPRLAIAALAVCVVLSVLSSGFVAVGVRSAAASLLMAFCLQGLAVIHVLTQGVAGRGGILTGVYVTLFLFLVPGWPVVLYALIGLTDSVLDLRARKAGRPAVPPT